MGLLLADAFDQNTQEMRIMPAGKGAKAHGEVGRGVLVLFRCRYVYRRGLGKRWSFWQENGLRGYCLGR
nr:hypothetical protein [Tanacetum cinerariifolium]